MIQILPWTDSTIMMLEVDRLIQEGIRDLELERLSEEAEFAEDRFTLEEDYEISR